MNINDDFIGKFIQPPILKKSIVDRLVSEYLYLQSIGEKPKNIPRCRLRRCNHRVDIREYVQGRIFCSDRCIKLFNIDKYNTHIRKLYRDKKIRKRCKYCDKYVGVDSIINDKGFCSMLCVNRHKQKKALNLFKYKLRNNIIERPRCKECNHLVPLKKITSVSPYAYRYCSTTCATIAKKRKDNTKHQVQYYRNCESCGDEFMTVLKKKMTCFDCNKMVTNIDYDMKVMDKTSAYLLGIFYNIAGFYDDHIQVYSRIDVINKLKEILKCTGEEHIPYERGSDIMYGQTDYYLLTLVGFQLLRPLHEYGLIRNILERDLPTISFELLPSFYDGLLYSSGIFVDSKYKYFPMVNKRICSYVSDYTKMPMTYMNGMWCLYIEHNIVNNIDYDKLYDDIVGEE